MGPSAVDNPSLCKKGGIYYSVYGWAAVGKPRQWHRGDCAFKKRAGFILAHLLLHHHQTMRPSNFQQQQQLHSQTTLD